MVKLGKPLPPVKEIAPPDESEIARIIAQWNSNCQPYYIGLMEAQAAGTPNATARFLYDPSRMVYIHRVSGRELSRKEVGAAFRYFNNKMATK